jgi:DNA-binding response OmpR family regulator
MILLVEDEAIARYALARNLSLSGYKVMAAADGQQAVELLDRHPFDVLITDLGLPKLSGFELIKHARSRCPETSVMVVSAETNGAEILDSKTVFFRKPVDANAVIAAVKRLVPRIVTLRDHSFICNWPPVWNKFTGFAVTDPVRQEVGILRQVRTNRLLPNQCFLLIEHQEEFFLGALIFNDAMFCHQIFDLLLQNVGKSIREIGSLDLSHTF